MLVSRGATSRMPAAIRPPALVRLLVAASIALATLAAASAPARAQGIEIEATPYLAGHVRPGAWAAVRVDVANDGPDFRGELRIRAQQQGQSIYAVEADLPNGSRKEFVLYARPPLFGTRLTVELVSGDATVASREVTVRPRDPTTPLVGVIAERPEAFQRDIEDALRSPSSNNSVVALLRPEDLPGRAEAWAVMDRLVWQDVDTARLSDRQLAALESWVTSGGQLIVVGGSAGPASLRSLPAELLPFIPERTVDVSRADLTDLLGGLPGSATSLPAVAGTLRDGAVFGRSGDSVYAARASRGQGSVTIIGIDPGAAWIARQDIAASLWRRAMPAGQSQFSSPFYLPDENSIFQNALYNLPAVALPPIEQLFVLLLAYIALIGPANYLVLRRLDRREWAWLTMPALVIVFAVGSYGMGAALKGSDVIINQVAIVRAAPDSTSGLGQVYIGVFSPSRRTFDVRVPGGALIAGPASQNAFGQQEPPIDALIGDTTSRLRNFEVGFGVMRGFRADAVVATPALRGDLRLVRGQIQGTVTNGSDAPIENVAVVFSGSVATIPALGPGETKEILIRPSINAWYALSEQMFGTSFSRDPAVQRKLNTRRAVIDQVTGYGPTVIGASPDAALLLGWREGASVAVELSDEKANRVGDSLYVVPLAVAYDRQAIFDDPLLVRTIIEVGSEQGWGERSSYSMERGTMVLELRPAGLAERFRASSLELAVTQSGFVSLRGNGDLIGPLPDREQPPQDAPLDGPVGSGNGTGPTGTDDPGEGGGGFGGSGEEPGKPAIEPGFGAGLPAVQLFDHAAGRWYELPELSDMRSYRIEQPHRWVDDSGRVLVRFVNRGNQGEVRWFTMGARMEGLIE
jgi:hypothetical protein